MFAFYPKIAQKTRRNFPYRFESDESAVNSEKTSAQIDIMTFLKNPCSETEDDLSQLHQHEYVKPLFLKFNSIRPASAVVERLFSYAGKINKGGFK